MVINVGLNEDGLFWLPAVFGFQFTNLAVCSGKLIVECIRWELRCDRADVYGWLGWRWISLVVRRKNKKITAN